MFRAIRGDDTHLNPSSLFNICLRLVTKNINDAEPYAFVDLPSYIKRKIVRRTTRYVFRKTNVGFKNEELLKALLDREMISLNLTNSTITNYTINNVAEICTNLHELLLDEVRCTLTEDELQEFLPKMKFLRLLNLKGVYAVTDKSISGLVTLTYLNHLVLKSCSRLTDGCIATLRNIKLQRLDMSCTQITDEWIGSLEFSPLYETVFDLNLSFCKNLTNRKLCALNWSKLKYLGLLGIDDIQFMDDVNELKSVFWSVPLV
ncbi:Protein AMN1 like [Pseudolycoriella hygida]|uniref:Protein AMN1 like n=1 Tax=Pseudolycoriella hygida TaxID=35572 RepID=A0A9Q0NBX6_9DIPT|nr:Protein AMN1 like [Pseudolycoriella hygida]